MFRVASVAEVREADARASASVGEAVLIARAAAAVARTAGALLGRVGGRVDGRVYGARVTVLAGSGHNGVDAIRAGVLLARRGAQVTVVRSSDRPTDTLGEQAYADLRAAGGRTASGLPATGLTTSVDLVLDGMVGVGARGGLRGRAAELAGAIAGLPTLAVDLPSGVDADTGAVGAGGAVRADVTVTFGARKPGLLLGAGTTHAGTVEVADVGLGLAGAPGALGALTDADVDALLPVPPDGADKYSRGVVGLLTGSPRYPGAGVLSTGGAVRGGAGYVRYLGGAPDAVRERFPTAVVGGGRCDAHVAGSGAGTDEAARDRVRELLAGDAPLVLDADGLAVGADALRGRRAPTLITPHAGEFRRLTGVDPAGDPLGSALAAARDLGVTVLLKGGVTVIAAPDGTARINLTGCPWLSTAGTGDVLSGACGAILAALVKRGHDPATVARDAGAAAAHLHGRAGWLASEGAPIAADSLLDVWSDAVRSVRSQA